MNSLGQGKNLVHRGVRLKQNAFIPFFQDMCCSRKYPYPRKGGLLKIPKVKMC